MYLFLLTKLSSEQIVSRYNTVRYNTVWYNTVRYNTVWYNMVQYNTVRYNTVQYDTIQYNTTQYGIIRLTVPDINKRKVREVFLLYLFASRYLSFVPWIQNLHKKTPLYYCCSFGKILNSQNLPKML